MIYSKEGTTDTEGLFLLSLMSTDLRKGSVGRFFLLHRQIGPNCDFMDLHRTSKETELANASADFVCLFLIMDCNIIREGFKNPSHGNCP